MKVYVRTLVFCLLAMLTTSCAQLNLGFDDPTLRLSGVSFKPVMSLQQQLKIRLNITNPNNYAMPVERMKYEISLDGFNMISGVTSSIGSIPANSSKDFSVTANVDLTGGIAMAAKMMKNRSKQVNYKLAAVIELDLPLAPSTEISKAGQVRLGR